MKYNFDRFFWSLGDNMSKMVVNQSRKDGKIAVEIETSDDESVFLTQPEWEHFKELVDDIFTAYFDDDENEPD